jgi:hypothetical protein
MVHWSVGEKVSESDRNHSAGRRDVDHADEEKVIPWAEGNGLWHTINRLASNLASVDVITFFVQNPYTCDSAESVAVRIGYRAAQIKAVMESLAAAGFLKTTDMNNLRVYELTDNPHRRQTLQQYVSWLQEGYHWARMAMGQPQIETPK